MIDTLIYEQLTRDDLRDWLKKGNDWRVYPAGSLGHAGVPAEPLRPYVQHGEGGNRLNLPVRHTRDSRTVFWDVFVYDNPGSYIRIKDIHQVIKDNLEEIAGKHSGPWSVTEQRLWNYSGDVYDPVNKINSVRATFMIIAGRNQKEGNGMTTKARKEQQEEQEGGSAVLVKYMGASDVRTVLKGDTFGGQLSDGVPKQAVWDVENSHIVDLDGLGWSADAIDLLLGLDLGVGGKDKEFVDVTGLDLVPVGLHQILWRGQKPHAKVEPGAKLPTQDTDVTTAGAVASGAADAVGDPAASTATG